MAKSTIIKIDLVTIKSPTENTSAGIKGTMNLRVAYTAAMEGIPKMIAVFILINPCLYLGKAPTKEEAPTII